jgi:hypothetical protein
MFNRLLTQCQRLWLQFWLPLWSPERLLHKPPEELEAHQPDKASALTLPTLVQRTAEGTTTTQLGHGLTFYGLKTYSPGDDCRMLDWASYARTRHPYIRQYQQEQQPVIQCVVLDSPLWHSGHHTPLWQFAVQAIQNLGQTQPQARFGLWVLAQDHWASAAPASATHVTHQLSRLMTGLSPTALPVHAYASANHMPIPENALCRDFWLVLSPFNHPRLAMCAHWPTPPQRLHLLTWADPWWQRWSPIAEGLPVLAGFNTHQPQPLATNTLATINGTFDTRLTITNGPKLNGRQTITVIDTTLPLAKQWQQVQQAISSL